MPSRPLTGLQRTQRKFALDVGQQTGFDPRVVYAWIVQEGAYAPGGTGGLNFLNLRPEKGDQYSSVSAGGFERFSSFTAAEDAAVNRIREIVLHVPAGAHPASAVTLAEHTTPSAQIGLIAASPWDESHYGGPGGPNLRAQFVRLFGANSLMKPATQLVTPAEATASKPAGTATTQGGLSAADAGSYDLTNAAHDAASAAGSVAGALGQIVKLLGFVFSLRFLELLGGAALLVFGGVSLLRAAK